MKKILSLFSVLVFPALLSSCSVAIFGINGNGYVIEESRTLEEYSSVEFGALGDVVLVQSAADFSADVRMDENLFYYLSMRVENGVLHIDFERNINHFSEIRFTLYCPEFVSVEYDGVGDLSSAGLTNSGDFTLDYSGVGSSDLTLSAQGCNVDFSGVGDMVLNSRTIALDLVWSGVGDCSVNGTNDTSTLRMSGTGNLNAQNLGARIATVNLSGVGDVHVSASESITGQLSGVGDVYTSGTATVDIVSTGVGSVFSE